MQIFFIALLIEMSFSSDQIKSGFAEQKNKFSELCIAGDELTEKSKFVIKKRQRENKFSEKVRN